MCGWQEFFPLAYMLAKQGEKRQTGPPEGHRGSSLGSLGVAQSPRDKGKRWEINWRSVSHWACW